MPIIRIDKDVYDWLQKQAVPFEDTPNSVIRTLTGLDKDKNKSEGCSSIEGEESVGKMVIGTNLPRNSRPSGKYFKQLWDVNVAHALYSEHGTFFENLNKFPGGLFDYNGYIIFKTENDYNNSPYLNIGKKLNVHNGISSIPGYKRMR